MLKVILIVLGVLFVLFIAVIGVFASISKLNSKEIASKEIVLEGTSGKKALVLYQKTKHDTATNITMALSEGLKENGYTVVINHPSSKLTYNIADYDIFASGSGVYMGGVSEPLKAYMEKQDFRGRSVLVYSVGSDLNSKDELELLKGKVNNADKLEAIKVSKGQESEMKAFVKKFLGI